MSSDLFCTVDDVDGATNQELKTMNAAITIEGHDAITYCKGHTVRQVAVDFGVESPLQRLCNEEVSNMDFTVLDSGSNDHY